MSEPKRPPSKSPALQLPLARAQRAADDEPAFRPLGAAGAAPLLERAGATLRTGTLEVRGDGGSRARITVREGRIVDAVSGTARGREAVLRIFLWTAGQYRWLGEGKAADEDRTELETAALVTEGLRRRAVWQLMIRQLPPLATVLLVDFVRLSSCLGELPPVAQDLCRLFDGRRTLADVFADAAMPELETASIVGHLLALSVLGSGEEQAAGRIHVVPTQQNLPAAPAPEPSPAPAVLAPRSPAKAADETFAADEETDVFAVASVASRPARRRSLALVGAVAAGGLAVALVASGVTSRSTRAPGGPAVAPAVTTLPSSPALSGPGHIDPFDDAVAVPSPPVKANAATHKRPLPPVAPPADRTLCLRGQIGDLALAVTAACERVLAREGARADVLSVLARAALEAGQFGRAGSRARAALALDPKLAEAYAYLGFAEAEAGRSAAALAAYRRYLDLAPRGRLADDIRAVIASSSKSSNSSNPSHSSP